MNNPTSGLNRRRLLALGGAGLGAAALSACGGPSTSGPAAPAASASAADYANVKPASEITFWSNHPGKSQEITQKLIDKFHAAQSAIKVTLVTAGANYEEVAQKFQTAQQGGQLPHIVVLSDVWWFRYMINQSIINLDPLISALDFKVDDYRKGLWDDYKYKGLQWAVPWARSTPLFYYNKDMWKTAGLEDRAPKTWEEFANWAPKLKEKNPAITAPYMHVAASDYDSWSLQNKVWGYGGAFSKEFEITCDSDAVIKALQFNQDGVYKDKWGAVSAKDAGADFSAGAAACTVTSTGSLVGILGNAKFDVGVGFLPGGPSAADMVCPTGGAGLGIPKAITKEQQLAAATFLKFITEPENTASFSEATGYMPVRTSANIDAVISKRPQAKVALDQLSHTRVQDFARVFLPGGDREIGMASADILTQQANIKERMTKLKTTLTGIYTNDVKPKLG
ncbi:MAG TPA: ABC transporter substrate-binding protein [Propionibacteriaceae bacterium]|nr:ABC transporter substrate-binding protein [Propionibacteriaceae bacterium]